MIARAKYLCVASLALVMAACTSAAPSDLELGFQAIGNKDYAAAEQYLTKANASDPNNPYVQLNLGVAEWNLGKLPQARALFQQVLVTGKGVVPQRTTSDGSAGKTLADLAQQNLDALK